MEEKKSLERVKESGTPGPAGADQDENEDDLVFPGFRFHPTDQELVGFYLTRKVEKKAFRTEIFIKEIDIYKHEPWDLPKWSHLKQGSGEKEWYFFCLRGRKYRNSIRPNRVTGSGFWKATGIDKPIYPSPSSASTSAGAGAGECIGLKKSLVYYRGSAGKGTKTDWMMHEFRLPSSSAEATINDASSPNTFQDAEIWTICRIFKRNMSYYKRCRQQQQDQHGKGASSINNKRSHQYYQQQQQLESYYHHHHYTCSASMATNSFESDARVDAERSHVTLTHQQPFLLHGFHGASSAAVPTPGMGAPPPSGWSELMSFRDGSRSWDELGRIMEISTDSTYL